MRQNTGAVARLRYLLMTNSIIGNKGADVKDFGMTAVQSGGIWLRSPTGLPDRL